MLASDERLTVREINYPLSSQRIFKASKAPGLSILRTAGTVARGLAAHLMVFGKFMVSGWRHTVYMPYPAPGVAFLFSLLPRQYRPFPIYCDAFISLYDTIVTDRRLISKKSLCAIVLRHFEKRAFSICSRIVVDTEGNRHYYATLFGMPEERFVPLALATNEHDYLPHPYIPKNGHCRVLFVGTFVPLQGIETITQTIRLLAEEKHIEFIIIGDGQEAHILERLLAEKTLPGVHWIRVWQNASEVASKIEDADICLGIFGTGDKTQRVWPYKNYHYMSVGRAIVTGETRHATLLARKAGRNAPFLTVPVSDPHALADILRKLARDPAQRIELANNARRFYTEHLANQHSHASLVSMLEKDARTSP